jgi:hypothetical protein
VGKDACPDSNSPAQSKRELLSTWPRPKIVWGVAKFIGLAQFYSVYIHHFELRITPLRDIMTKYDYTEMVVPHWMDMADKALKDIQQDILSDPCLMRFNHWHLVVIRTDFSSVGFGFVVCQPVTDVTLELAMFAYPAGKGFAFMCKDSSATLHPVAFGGQKYRGNESHLHSHLGKGFAGNWAINKNCHMLLEQDLCGLLTAMPFVLFCPMKVPTPLSFAFKCS